MIDGFEICHFDKHSMTLLPGFAFPGCMLVFFMPLRHHGPPCAPNLVSMSLQSQIEIRKVYPTWRFITKCGIDAEIRGLFWDDHFFGHQSFNKCSALASVVDFSSLTAYWCMPWSRPQMYVVDQNPMFSDCGPQIKL